MHVYVHKDGWILAYYLRTDRTSKIIDAKNRTITTTKLKTVVAAVASAAGAPFNDVSYYDFRYPNATNMLLIAEDVVNGQDFTIFLPSNYSFYERGWAMYTTRLDSFDGFLVDGVDIIDTQQTWGGDYMRYGTISAAQLLPDITHTIVVSRPNWDTNSWGAVVIVYRVP